jgi:hypothetical protein
MDIGAPAPVGGAAPASRDPRQQVEGRVLAIREPRKRPGAPPGQVRERRQEPERLDPRGGRVLVLMIPDGSRLPPDLQDGGYRVFLRFARR